MTLAQERDTEVVYPDPTPPVLGGFQGLPARPGWFSQHLGTAVLGGVGGYLLGHWLGNMIGSGYSNVQASGINAIAVTGGLVLGVLGWLLGIGALNYPVAKMFGLEPRPEYESTSWTRYLRYTADHKVVGIQYVIGVLVFFFTGGLLAMAIRTELLSPTNHVFGAGTYISVVGEHGTIMMMMATSVIMGPLGNWLVPLMIGATRIAFPRVEAFSFWIFSAGYFVILSALLLRRVPDRLDRLRTAADPGRRGHDVLPGRLRGDRSRHDGRRLQPGRHHHQLPGPGHDAGAGCRSSCGPCSPPRPF